MDSVNPDMSEYVTGPDVEAVWHLARASAIMSGIADAAEDNGGLLDFRNLDGMFRQAEIHAAIGTGYAALAAAHAPPAVVAPPTPPPDVYPNG